MTQPSRIDGLPDLPDFSGLHEAISSYSETPHGVAKGARRQAILAQIRCMLEDYARSAAAAQAAKQVPAWQPIETAPTVGSILLWWKNAGACTGSFAVDEEWQKGSATPREGWKGDGDECIPRNQEDCTHWQVLRAPDGCRWPRFSDGHCTQEWLEKRYAAAPSATSLAEAAEAGQVEAIDDGLVTAFPHIALGHGLVEIGDATWEGLPALFFGKNGAEVGPIGSKRVRDNLAQDGETLALITFANLKGLEQVEDALGRVRRNMEASQGKAQ